MSKNGFRELMVWQKAKALAVEVYQLTRADRLTDGCGLVDQMRRSAVSVPSNIAEGDERGTDKDAVRHFYIAKGSLAELITQLEIAGSVGYLHAAQMEPAIRGCDEVGRMLGGLSKARRSHTHARFVPWFLGVSGVLALAALL